MYKRQTLEYGLSHLCTKKKELELLWNQPTLGRNVFDEMIDAGASKVENEIKNHKTISPEKKALADWYAKLLVNNYLVTVRWWFAHSDTISASQIDVYKRQAYKRIYVPSVVLSTPAVVKITKSPLMIPQMCIRDRS